MEYFTKFNPYSPCKAHVERKRVMDIRDEKWAHPILRELPMPWYSDDMGATSSLYSPDVSTEDKIKLSEQLIAASVAAVTLGEVKHTCDITTYKVPGCVEEPDAPEVEVLVYRPKDLKKKKARCMYYVMGGALTMAEPSMFPLEELASRHNCVIVTAKYRVSFVAKYPAAVNDIHAAYAWMIDNAEMLQINPKNVVLYGISSGGHLALSLAFRLKRYGYSPKGIVALMPQTDDREDGRLSVYNGCWDSISQHDALMQWLGRDFGSDRVGPEALANHATVEECIGYPPTVIHTGELDSDRNYNREFYGKLLEAQTYAEYHCWGGAMHGGGTGYWAGVCFSGETNKLSSRVKAVVDGNVEDFFEYDFRRPWVVEEYNNR